MEKIKFYLETEFPLALDSLDYKYPVGAIQDNYKRQKFNDKLRKYSNGSVLDFGCAGGGFVKSCIDEGRIAVGLEGTDFNKKEGRFEWITVPDNLFTCDLTKPFTLHTGDKIPYQFDILTAWEFLEHIEKKDLNQLFINIMKHLVKGGLLFCTVDNNVNTPRYNKEINLHRTMESREWWVKQFEQCGFIEDREMEGHFAGRWVRDSRSPLNYKFIFIKKV